MSSGEAGRQCLDDVETLYNNDYRESMGSNVNARWRLYADAETLDPQKEIIASNLEGVESVLDIGCGQADILWWLSRGMRRPGALVGLDRDLTAIEVSMQRNHEIGAAAVSLVGGRFEQLPFPDESFDRLISMFALYHANNLPEALEEMTRVLKTGCVAIIGTSGVDNKPRHREFEAKIAAALGCEPPPRYNRIFTAEIAADLLPQYFSVENSPQGQIGHQWSSEYRINGTSPVTEFADDKFGKFVYSLLSMKRSYDPMPSFNEWADAFTEYCMPVIEEEIEANGYFSERLSRSYYVCRKLSGND